MTKNLSFHGHKITKYIMTLLQSYIKFVIRFMKKQTIDRLTLVLLHHTK